MWECNVFILFVRPHLGGGGGYPSPRFFPRSLLPGPFWEGHTPVLAWGVPILARGEGYPNPGWGTPSPSQDSGLGTLPPGQDRGIPWPGLGCPPAGQGPPSSTGVPLPARTGVPPSAPLPQTDYAAGVRFPAGGLSCSILKLPIVQWLPCVKTYFNRFRSK